MQARACPADSLGVTTPVVPECISTVEGVAALAVRLSLIPVSCPASDVLGVSYSFEMGGVHARAISTQVIQFEAIWNRTDQCFVDDPMGAAVAFPGHTQNPVALGVDATAPRQHAAGALL